MSGRRSAGLVVLSAGYLLAALVVGLWPTPVDAGIHAQIFAALALLHGDGVPGGFGYAALEFGANIAFFVPIGVLLSLLLPRRSWWAAIPLGALLSGAIELSQLLLLPARYASWGDIAANTIGTVVGVLIVLLARAIRRPRAGRLSAERSATTAEPGPERGRSRVR